VWTLASTLRLQYHGQVDVAGLFLVLRLGGDFIVVVIDDNPSPRQRGDCWDCTTVIGHDNGIVIRNVHYGLNGLQELVDCTLSANDCSLLGLGKFWVLDITLQVMAQL
jgi:hypothetical protein